MPERKSLLSWNSLLQRLQGAFASADRTAETLLRGGIERWEREGRLGTSQATALRVQLSSGQARDALHHLGVHILLSAPIPIPGIQNLARLAWTLAFAVRVQVRRLCYRAAGSDAKLPNIHGPLVMVLSLIPIFGSLAYLAARPLRRKLLLRLVMDQTARTLPLGLYRRLHLEQVLAPTPEVPESHDYEAALAGC